MTRAFIASSILLFSLLLINCSSGGADSEDAALIAASDYTLFLTVNPASIWEAEFTKNFFNSLPFNASNGSPLSVQHALASSSENVQQMSFAIESDIPFHPIDIPKNLIWIGRGTFDEADVRNMVQQYSPDIVGFEEDAVAGFKMFRSKGALRAELAYSIPEKVAYMGYADSVEDSLKMAAGNIQSLAQTEAFKTAAGLLAGSGQITALVLDAERMTKSFAPTLVAAGRNIGLEDEFFASVQEMTSAAAVCQIDADLSITARALFAADADAEIFLNGLQNIVDQVTNMTTNMKFKPAKEIIDALVLSRNGKQVELRWNIAGEKVLEFYNARITAAIENSRQKTTLVNMRMLASAIEHYIVSNPGIGAPAADDIKELKKLLIDEQYVMNDALFVDAWGNELIYKKHGGAGSKEFRLISYGADRKQGPNPAKQGVVTLFEEDLIFETEAWIQAPDYKP